MKADPFVQLKLLDVQALDSQLDGLRTQITSMPETAELARLIEQRDALVIAVRNHGVDVDDLTAEQKKADRDVESVRARRERDQGLVDSGGVSNPKDLERMLHELESLARRISDLEDVEIEVMERLEAAQAARSEAEAKLSQVVAEITEVEAKRDQRSAAIKAEGAEVTRERAQTADGMPADLMDLYAKLRAQKGGVGAAELRARQCGGCRLTLDASILSTMREAPTDEVLRCEECGRILVRTGESGL
ncbi:MAG TPA: C4-type zinc ribbon domain-containing protein [Marmoricola sp.]|nr:C4-type zinc ribbon domain-containing protein [Marmoricola sp.]